MKYPVTTSYAAGTDVRVVLTLPDASEFLHYGTVYRTRRLPNGSHLHMVSGLLGEWIHASRLGLAPRSRGSETL